MIKPGNPSHFRKNLLKWVYIKIMTIDDHVMDGKPKYDIKNQNMSPATKQN